MNDASASAISALALPKPSHARALVVGGTMGADVALVLARAGCPSVVLEAGHGIVAPAATPKAVVARLNQAINEIFADPAFKKKWEELGTPIVGGTPEAFGTLMRTESVKLGKLVKDAGVTVD